LEQWDGGSDKVSLWKLNELTDGGMLPRWIIEAIDNQSSTPTFSSYSPTSNFIYLTSPAHQPSCDPRAQTEQTNFNPSIYPIC
jgi:hypothetical protein